MGKTWSEITPDLEEWISDRKMFFVATAPRSDEGLVNCSPKGLDSFRIIDPHTVAYLDLTGSGIETVAHLRENGRIVIMFCAFQGPPRIVRLHGQGVVHQVGTGGFDSLATRFEHQPGQRAIIEIRLARISDSCGYGVPRFEYVDQRETLIKSALRKGPEGLTRYREEKNRQSLDGLPGWSG